MADLFQDVSAKDHMAGYVRSGPFLQAACKISRQFCGTKQDNKGKRLAISHRQEILRTFFVTGFVPNRTSISSKTLGISTFAVGELKALHTKGVYC